MCVSYIELSHVDSIHTLIYNIRIQCYNMFIKDMVSDCMVR